MSSLGKSDRLPKIKKQQTLLSTWRGTISASSRSCVSTSLRLCYGFITLQFRLEKSNSTFTSWWTWSWSPKILTSFYRCTIENFLNNSVTVWYSTVSEKRNSRKCWWNPCKRLSVPRLKIFITVDVCSFVRDSSHSSHKTSLSEILLCWTLHC